MKDLADNPFPSIESALEYVELLGVAVQEARVAVERDIPESGPAAATRRVEALRLVCYKLTKLEQNMQASRRLLHDLRILRRLMLREEGVSVTADSTSIPAKA